MDPADVAAVAEQLGRPPRGLRAVAHRCPCGLPDVVETEARLPDGTPFPTLYYLTCPRANSAIGTLEATGMMREMNERLTVDDDLRWGHLAAHTAYLLRRREIEDVPEIDGVSAGGMPDRVKCLHVLVAHALAAGPGVNPFGDQALAALAPWWEPGPCVGVAAPSKGTAGMTRVAAVDCGTNSIRLLVADIEGNTLTDVDRRMEIVRLGEGVDRTGRFVPSALERTFAACRRYAEAIETTNAERVRFVATSASRDVVNRDEFVDGVRAVLGVEPEVISGDEEARLSFLGATRELVDAGYDTPFLVVDIGGGSTEFVLGGTTVQAARSVDVGCVRMTERHLHDDPPTAAQVAAARADIDAAIAVAAGSVPIPAAATLVGLAGSVTTVAAMALDLPAYLPERIHRSAISGAEVHSVAERLLGMTSDQRAALPFMHPGRVDVIGAGALILACVVAAAGVEEVLVSEHDILDGIAWSIA